MYRRYKQTKARQKYCADRKGSAQSTGRYRGLKSVEGSTALIHYSSITEVAGLIEARALSPVELTQLLLDRIASLDDSLHSYATVMAESAAEAAATAEREILAGNYRGPLHGVPVAVKDLCYTKGVPTMGGLAVLADFAPEFDATVVARLREAGAVLLGKLNLTEGAFGGYHRDFAIPVNPWNAEWWPGASSSGSGVATAAGLCYASLGSDTGGSIRFPSLANGIVGLKPTYGRVSRHGVLALADSLDHVGPMTRRSADAAIVFEAIAGFDEREASSLPDPVLSMTGELAKGVRGVVIGYDQRYATEMVDPELVAAIGQALADLEREGAVVREIDLPAFTDELSDAWFKICAKEACTAHRANFPLRADEYGAFFRGILEMGSSVSDAEYAAATQLRNDFSSAFTAALATVDALASPAGGKTFALVREQQYGNADDLQELFDNIQMQFTVPADFAGIPAISLPCGVSREGFPLTIQFMGKHLSEAMLCRIGHAYEEITEWHMRHPPV